MLTLTGWNILALIVLYFIDFEKGKVEAGRVEAHGGSGKATI